MSQYEIIARSIEIITRDPKVKFNLEQIGMELELSPDIVQETLYNWAGISLSQLQKYLSLEYAKNLLESNKIQVLSNQISQDSLHDIFVDITIMTPEKSKNLGQNLTINYSIHDSQFGNCIIASTDIGICNVLFLDDISQAKVELQSRWKNAKIIMHQSPSHQSVIDIIAHQKPANNKIKLDLHGTDYQIKVWRALLQIPKGSIKSYGQISKNIGDTTSLGARSTGTAIGNNPIAYLIPCHRVLQSSGAISGYRWGITRKRAMLVWEYKIQTKTQTPLEGVNSN